MNNQIIRQTQIPISEITTIAKAFAESGMFQDTKQAAQAIVKIQAGQEMGIPPFAAMSGIHIIQGKPTVGSGLIASCIKKSGKYDYTVEELTEAKCSIDFYEGKDKVGNSTFTIEEARKAGTKNLEKFPKNMLFARAISNGVKFYCPDVFSGPVYVPEEMEGVQQTVDTDATVVPTDTPQQPVQELPWLNIRNKEGKLTNEGVAVTLSLRNGSDSLDNIKQHYRINKAANDELSAIKVLAAEEWETIEIWAQVINNCTTIEELHKKYKENESVWNSTIEIYIAFVNKSKVLNKKQPA